MKISKLARQLRRSFVDLFASSPIYRGTALVSALLVVLMTLLPIWRIIPIASDKPFIPLHYNIYLGIDRFGPWYGIFLLPAIGATMLIINVAFEAVFFRREHVLSKFFAFATVFSEIVLSVAMVLIVLLNL